ncbi:MAG: hypothetical protein FGM20_07560 [Burkholderiaceae bacterium]|jgi:hypothetical protein|nr:hypothetical protein [Burkholderiaceae bacterium]
MSVSSQFFIDLERGELCALDRFLERSRSTLNAAVLETSSAALSSALQAMQQTVRHAVQQLEKDALINEVSVAMQLLDEQADAAALAFRRLTVSELDLMLEDEEVSNDASLALWKILDVIGPIEVRL